MDRLLPPATPKQGARVGLNGAAAGSASGASKSTTAVHVLVASKWHVLNHAIVLFPQSHYTYMYVYSVFKCTLHMRDSKVLSSMTWCERDMALVIQSIMNSYTPTYLTMAMATKNLHKSKTYGFNIWLEAVRW